MIERLRGRIYAKNHTELRKTFAALHRKEYNKSCIVGYLIHLINTSNYAPMVQESISPGKIKLSGQAINVNAAVSLSLLVFTVMDVMIGI